MTKVSCAMEDISHQVLILSSGLPAHFCWMLFKGKTIYFLFFFFSPLPIEEACWSLAEIRIPILAKNLTAYRSLKKSVKLL